MRKTVSVSPIFFALFIIIWLALFIFGSGYWRLLSQSEDEILTVEHDIYNFTIDYPGKYIARQYGNEGYRGHEELKLRIEKTSYDKMGIWFEYREFENPIVDDVLRWRNEQSKLGSVGTLKKQLSPVEIDEYDAWELDYTYENGTSVNEVYVLRDNDMFIITLLAPSGSIAGYRNDFEFILNSFQPLEN
mgnify:CR=1 FL=1